MHPKLKPAESSTQARKCQNMFANHNFNSVLCRYVLWDCLLITWSCNIFTTKLLPHSAYRLVDDVEMNRGHLSDSVLICCRHWKVHSKWSRREGRKKKDGFTTKVIKRCPGELDFTPDFESSSVSLLNQVIWTSSCEPLKTSIRKLNPQSVSTEIWKGKARKTEATYGRVKRILSY